MKLKTLLFLSLIAIALAGCDNEYNGPQDCVAPSQAESTNWFQDYIAQFEDDTTGYWYLSAATYNSQTVYLPGNCCPNCLTVPVVLDCQGERIGTLGNGDDEIDPDAISNVEIIWRSPNFVCTN